jgi:hypothetical protein
MAHPQPTGTEPMIRILPIACLALFGAPLFAGSPFAAADDPAVEINIMELTQIDWSPGSKLPKKVSALDGKKVKITGFMALDTPEGTSSFRLTYDQCGCSNAKASHFVEVDMGDETVGYNPDEVSLTGTFAVGEKREDGFVVSLYRMKADSIE